jgi:ParB family transcriptional regulator, chromosome partitioning protein
MAKRRRLTSLPFLSPVLAPAPADGPAPRRPPIAEVAGEAAAASALEAMAERLERARAEGRMIQALPLDALDAGYLVRDRLGIEAEAQAALIASIRARGQQVPVEVVELGQGRYGLISGWRRLAALKRLHAETGDAAFATVLAILRRPTDAADAYLAMVEENELRVGLSYYERARIVARAVEAGVYPDRAAALRGLFAAASRARRSKIGSFLAIHAALDGALRFPQAIPERLGLRLAQALEADIDLAARIRARLAAHPPADAEAELALLARLAAPASASVSPARPADPTPVATEAPARGEAEHEPPSDARADAPPDASGGLPTVTYEPERGRITLTGPGIDAALARRLRAWLEGQG